MSPAMSIELAVLAEGTGYLHAVWRNLFILDFRSTPTIEGLERSLDAKKIAVERSPAGLAVLNFLGPGPLPNAEVREVAAAVQHKDVRGTLCHATVVEATGFSGSAMRSVLTGLNAFGKVGYPRKVFGTSDEALRWQATTLNAPPGWMEAAREAIETVRQRRPR